MAKALAFTARTLESLRPSPKVYEVHEAGRTGLVVRVSPTGVKSFRWRRRPPGKGSKGKVYTLGIFGNGTGGTITLSAVHAKLDEYKAKLAAGVDPEGSATGERPRTVRQLCDLFYADEILPHRKRPGDVLDIINRSILPTIGNLPLSAVDTVRASAPVRVAVERGAKVHASKVLQVVKQLFAFAANRGFVPVSPAASLKPRSLQARTATKGKRWLRAEEVVELLRALDRSGMDPTTRLGLRLLMLTALRTNEALTLKWADIDFEGKTLTVRAENRKMSPGKAEEAGDWSQPLSDAALEVLRTLRAICPPTASWVFHSARSETGHTDDHALGRAMKRVWRQDEGLRKVLAALKEKAERDPALRDIRKKPEASPHDLRRTVATHLVQTLRVDRVTAQLVLGHSLNRIIESGVAETYDRGTAMEERRVALDRFAAWVREQTDPTSSGARVVALAR